MRPAKLTKTNHMKVLSAVEKILRSGGVVILPTDTVYGIVGDATNAETVKKIYEIKNRPEEKAFPVFVKDVATARKYAYISDTKAKFLEKVWPGPVTVVFQHKDKLPKILTGRKDTIGLRIPDNFFLRELLMRLEAPLVQTSANISNQPPAKNIKEIEAYFHNSKVRPDFIIDEGSSEGKQSTVIDFTASEPIVLRTGLVSRAELDQLLRSVKL